MGKEHLKLELSKAVETYKKGDGKIKALLIDLYGKEYFLLDVKDRVIDYESACKETSFKPLTIEDFEMLPEEDRNRYYARHQLTVGIRALVGDYKPDWDNSSEYKYYNYMYKEDGGFVSGVRSYAYLSYLGSDFYFPNREIAEHAYKTFKKQYITYLF